MPKTLIIAEKPSVAKDIASALGVPKHGNLYENSELVISNCLGHLVELSVPQANEKGAKLPIIPGQFELRAIASSASQFKIVRSLLQRKDIGCVINACDAGREGESIFRLTYELARANKPMERMWLQTMTKGGILSAYQSRKPGSSYDNLADAARSRGEADWLFGINGSRALKRAVGRVITPTLAMIVDRYQANARFISEEYFELWGTFQLPGGSYSAKWSGGVDGDSQKTPSKEELTQLLSKCKTAPVESAKDAVKPVISYSPPLYDLTMLQREANQKFKFSAKKTLEIAQALYERHKVATYPRTNSNALPEDYVEKCTQVIHIFSKTRTYGAIATQILEGAWVKPVKRIFDNTKISDHFAIIPTGIIPNGLSADEHLIFDLIARRFMAVFYPPAQYEQTVRTTVVAKELFRVSGKVLTEMGWLAVYKDSEKGSTEDDGPENPSLPNLPAGVLPQNSKMELKSCQTKAPPLLTEATLLRAMELAGKFVEDNALASALKECGLGTPATRADTIDKLLKKGKDGASFVVRQKNCLVPTEKGIALITHLKSIYPSLTSPEMTARWEQSLLEMEQGMVSRKAYMHEIARSVTQMVQDILSSPPLPYVVSGATSNIASGQNSKNGNPKRVSTFNCPACMAKDGVTENEKVYRCGCGLTIWKLISGRELKKAEITQLLKNGRTQSLAGFVSKKTGRSFSGSLVLDLQNKNVRFDFN